MVVCVNTVVNTNNIQQMVQHNLCAWSWYMGLVIFTLPFLVVYWSNKQKPSLQFEF